MTTLYNVPSQKNQINWEKISTWLAALGIFFMFWQSQRDIHNDINTLRIELSSDIKDVRKDVAALSDRVTRIEKDVTVLSERVTRIETRLEQNDYRTHQKSEIHFGPGPES